MGVKNITGWLKDIHGNNLRINIEHIENRKKLIDDRISNLFIFIDSYYKIPSKPKNDLRDMQKELDDIYKSSDLHSLKLLESSEKKKINFDHVCEKIERRLDRFEFDVVIDLLKNSRTLTSTAEIKNFIKNSSSLIKDNVKTSSDLVLLFETIDKKIINIMRSSGGDIELKLKRRKKDILKLLEPNLNDLIKTPEDFIKVVSHLKSSKEAMSIFVNLDFKELTKGYNAKEIGKLERFAVYELKDEPTQDMLLEKTSELKKNVTTKRNRV